MEDKASLTMPFDEQQKLVSADIGRYSSRLGEARMQRIELAARLKSLEAANREDPMQVVHPVIIESDSVSELRQGHPPRLRGQLQGRPQARVEGAPGDLSRALQDRGRRGRDRRHHHGDAERDAAEVDPGAVVREQHAHGERRQGDAAFRIEDTLRRDGLAVDRGTLSRVKKLVGDALAPTVVKAMLAHARASAFCISTDATGVCVQPIQSDKGSQPCKKGHFLVMIADRDHIVFEYLEKETGPAIYERFRGFAGYVQADAKAVFNLLFADAAELERKAPDLAHDGCERTEVGCWYHCRRRYWEAAVAKCPIGREGLVRLGRIFQLDASWQDKPPSEIKRLRAQYLRPHVDSFFPWVDEQRPLFKDQRGLARTALQYAHNQREVLARFFDDGRLVLTNNGAERAMKAIALGRKAWLFCGSDDHAKSTAALYSLIASARLHGLDPEDYLRCLIRLVPLWPEHRMLERSTPQLRRPSSRRRRTEIVPITAGA